MYDSIIKGGRIVDGTGAAPFTADVGIRDGMIAEIGDLSGAAAGNLIDADGATVTPGWIDAHTHYDGQVTWDDELEGSVANGTTTVVMGNCGVGFAPIAPSAEDTLIDFMEGVEDIPGTALHEGIPWGEWETFPGYLDFLGRRQLSIDVAAQVPHAPLRLYVMGDRAADDLDATEDDLARMTAVVEEAVRAGAVGFSTSRIQFHRTASGKPLPGTFAPPAELHAIARGLAAGGGAVFQAVPAGAVGTLGGSSDRSTVVEEVSLFGDLSRAAGIRVNFSVSQMKPDPELWREAIAASNEENARGAQLFPMVGSRGISGLTSLRTYHVFSRRPTFLRLSELPYAEMVKQMRNPEVKAAILAESDQPTDQPGSQENIQPRVFASSLDITYPLSDPLDYEPSPDRTFAARAAAEGRDPFEYLYDYLLEDDGNAVGVRFNANYLDGNLDACREMLLDPGTVWSLTDAGAHVRFVCDMSAPTFNLVHWVRDRTRGERIPIETMVAKMTSTSARLYGLRDRGTLAVGMRADVNVIDLAGLTVHRPELRSDLPAGGGRFLQSASGYVATMVNGCVARRDGRDTGDRPGRLVRGNADHATK